MGSKQNTKIIIKLVGIMLSSLMCACAYFLFISDKFESNYFSIKLYNAQDNICKSIKVKKNTIINEDFIEKPSKDGYKFDYWTNYYNGIKINFPIKVNSNVSFIADWHNLKVEKMYKGLEDISLNNCVDDYSFNVDYDNSMPNITVSWCANTNFKQFAIKIDGGEKIYTSKEYANLFKVSNYGYDYFDATGLIDVTKGSHRFAIKGLNNEETKGSQYSNSFVCVKVEAKQKKFLSTKTIFGNEYITNEDELYKIYCYTFLKRISYIQFYMGYNFAYPNYNNYSDFQLLMEKMFERCSRTGKYKLKYNYNLITQVGSIKINYITDQNPSKSFGFNNLNVNNLDKKLLFYFDNNSSNDGSYQDEFPIDDYVNSAKVETSEELFQVVNMGYKPIPVTNSNADIIYKKARSIVSQITYKSMSKQEKLLAIYDWIIWHTTYDLATLDVEDISEAVKYDAFYLEGVFKNYNLKQGQRFDYYSAVDDNIEGSGLAVCDGIAKAYVLMSNIVGITSIKINGYVQNNNSIEGHAWAKSYLDFGWFNVDPTWGSLTFINEETYKQKTYITHLFFLISDKQIKESGHEEIKYGNYPYAINEYNIFKDLIYNNVYLYIKKTMLQYQLENILYYFFHNNFDLNYIEIFCDKDAYLSLIDNGKMTNQFKEILNTCNIDIKNINIFYNNYLIRFLKKIN